MTSLVTDTSIAYEADDEYVVWPGGTPRHTGILVHFADGRCCAVDIGRQGQVILPVQEIPDGDFPAVRAPDDLIEPAKAAALKAFADLFTEFEFEGETYGVKVDHVINLRMPDGTVHREGEAHDSRATRVIDHLRDEIWIMRDSNDNDSQYGSREAAEAAAEADVGEDHTWRVNPQTRQIEYEATDDGDRSAVVWLDPTSELEMLLDA